MSSTSVRGVSSSTTASTGHGSDAYAFYFSTINGGPGNSLLLQPLTIAVWQDPDEPLSRLRRTVASWLAGNPYPSLGPRKAPLSDVVHLILREPSLSPILRNSTTPQPHLKFILLSPESYDVFTVTNELEQEVLVMDELALRRAAASANGMRGDLESIHLLSPPWRLSSGSVAGSAAAQLIGGNLNTENGMTVTYNNDSGNNLTTTASYMTTSSTTVTSCTGSSQLRTVFSFGTDDCDAVDPHANVLSQTVLNAVASAWPGNTALARLKRRAALALASATDGPEGPHSMLASALGDVLHRHEADAVAELRHPVTKTLRVKQLLHEGGPMDAVLPSSMTRGSTVQLGLVGQPAGGSVAGIAAAAPGGTLGGVPGVDGAGFLRVVKGKFDIVVMLDLPGLLRSHGHRQSAGLQGSTLPTTVGDTVALAGSVAATPAAAMLLPTSLSAGGIGASIFNPTALLPAADARAPLARSTSDLAAAIDQGFILGSQTLGVAGPFSANGVGLVPTAAMVSTAVEGFPELALRAFPGPSAGAQLRRAIVVHLASLPRRSEPWTHLGVFVAGSQAHLWLKPANRWPKLKAFVMHPDSRGAFLDVHLPGPGTTTGGLVALDPAALRRASTSGLAAAITCCWPGQAPLERIRRAAAFTLAFAVRGPAGPYTMLGSALGTAIRKRDKEAFDALAGVGKLSELLDDTVVGSTVNGNGGVGSAIEAARESAGSGSGGGGSGTASGTGTPAIADWGMAEAAERGSSDGGGETLQRSSSSGGAAGCCNAGAGTGTAADVSDDTCGSSGDNGTGGGDGGGGGSGGTGGGGGGYIVSFKKDQDGYMRLRLEALLLDWPKEELGASATIVITAATSADPGSAACANSSGQLLSLGMTTDGNPTSDVAAGVVGYTSSSSGTSTGLSTFASLVPSFSAPAPLNGLSISQLTLGPGAPNGGSGGVGPVAAAAVSPVSDVGSPPLEQELMRRFPPPPGAPTGSEQVTIAAAKRCIARLLAWAPPPHQLTFAKLGAQVPKLLGGARIGRNLRLVCLEEPDVFAVQSQSPTVHVVRLVCPRFLQLAHEQSERKHSSAQHPHSNNQNQHPNQLPPQPQQQQQVVQVFAQHPGAIPQQHAIGQNPLQLTVRPGQIGGSGGSGSFATQLQQLNLHQPQQQQMQGVAAVLAARAGQGAVQQPQTGLGAAAHPSSLVRVATGEQRLLLQPQGTEHEADLQHHASYIRQVQVVNATGSSNAGELSGRSSTSGPAGWSTAWQQQHTPAQQQQQQLLLLQSQSQTQQQQQVGISTLRHQTSLGSTNSGGPGGAGGGAVRLYDERLSLNGSAPLSSLSSVGRVGRAVFSASNLSIDSAQLSWHSAGGGGVGGNNLAQHQTQQLQLQQQQQMAVAAAAAAAATRSTVGQRLQDFAASAIVAEQALQQQHAQTHGGAVASAVPSTPIHLLSDPYSPDFLSVLQHCHSCAQIGIAVQVYDGRPALVSLYAPSAVAMSAGNGNAATGAGSGTLSTTEAWPPAVYVLDCTASSAGEGPEAMVGVLLNSLRGLLEEPGVAKVVHGCEQVRTLEVASGATIAPLLDTSILLNAILTMLPPLPPPPPVAAVAVAAAAGQLPPGGYSSTEAAAIAQLCNHVVGLRTMLQSVELWADRPELLSVLSGVHFAAHRAELWAASGRDSNWLSRPLSEGQVAVAAQSVHHLPDLWAALCEAVPWLAAHAALRVMQHLRSSSALGTATAGVPGLRVQQQA